jgi:UDP-N-acetylmuramoyl-tripeptide--D-alanyl-D-alanine ligase
MPDGSSIWVVPVVAAQVVLTWRRLLAYLRYYQQEGYEAARFLKWTGIRPFTDPAFWLAFAASWLWYTSVTWSAVLCIAGAIVLAAGQPDPRRTGKITLKMTWRATRVAAVTALASAGLWLTWIALDEPGLRAVYTAQGVVVVVLPLLLVVANALLNPYERAAQRGYEADAVRRLADVQPFIVGITGSYGKSSTKSMLAHILQFKGPTLAAAGSINTLMGNTRHIRENLVYGHQFMVVEMGAYHVGSIRRLCQLTPPSAAIITAVGDAHLERFGSLDNIVQAKSELARALPPGGLLVVNADFPGALRIGRTVADRRLLLYGETMAESLDTRLEQVRFTIQGTHFVLRTKSRTYECFTPIHGRPIVLNLAGAFTLAVGLGVDPDIVVASFRTLKPVSNRLELVEDGGITWVRDAYNSNQYGFRAALEVAAALPARRRVLVTPGVVELGPMQREVNHALSADAARVCDTTLVVSVTNREAFAAGHAAAGHADRLVPVENRTEAFRWIREHVKPGDAVILENDLPDLYERSEGVFWRDYAGQQGAR